MYTDAAPVQWQQSARSHRRAKTAIAVLHGGTSRPSLNQCRGDEVKWFDSGASGAFVFLGSVARASEMQICGMTIPWLPENLPAPEIAFRPAASLTLSADHEGSHADSCRTIRTDNFWHRRVRRISIRQESGAVETDGDRRGADGVPVLCFADVDFVYHRRRLVSGVAAVPRVMRRRLTALHLETAPPVPAIVSHRRATGRLTRCTRVGS